MNEELHEIGLWLNNGPIAISALAFVFNAVFIAIVFYKFIPAINQLTEAIGSLKTSNIQMCERFSLVEKSVDNLVTRVDQLGDRVDDLEKSGTINRPQ